MPINYTTRGVPREELGEAFHEFDLSGRGFIADTILPPLGVAKKDGKISVIQRENATLVNVDHANGAAYNRVNMLAKDFSYALINKGLEEQLTDQDRENYKTDFDAEEETVQDLKLKMAIAREVRVAAAIFNTTTFTGASLYKDWSAAPWDAAASDALGHIEYAKNLIRANTGILPDSMVIGYVTLTNLLLNTAILTKFPGVQVLTRQMLIDALPAIFGLKNVYVGMQSYNTAKEGQAFSGGDVWSDDYALVYKQHEGATKTNPGLGRTLLWDPLTPNPATITSYYESQTKSEVFNAEEFIQECIFDAYFGCLLKVDA